MTNQPTQPPQYLPSPMQPQPIPQYVAPRPAAMAPIANDPYAPFKGKQYFQLAELVQINRLGPPQYVGHQARVVRVEGNLIHFWIPGTSPEIWVPVNAAHLNLIGPADANQMPPPVHRRAGPQAVVMTPPSHNITPQTFGAQAPAAYQPIPGMPPPTQPQYQQPLPQAPASLPLPAPGGYMPQGAPIGQVPPPTQEQTQVAPAGYNPQEHPYDDTLPPPNPKPAPQAGSTEQDARLAAAQTMAPATKANVKGAFSDLPLPDKPLEFDANQKEVLAKGNQAKG